MYKIRPTQRLPDVGRANPTDPTVIAEIRVLEEKLSKARAVKAGMMSALLIEKIRLV
ncbi:MAG: hypothetical protein IH588_08615 [Anaerolineales bacterium]|nr:hypothetical protein [Anaerolineales bacterium]